MAGNYVFENIEHRSERNEKNVKTLTTQQRARMRSCQRVTFGCMPTSIGGWLAHAIHEESRCTQNFHVDWFENDGAVLEHRTTISICTLSVTLCCTCAFHTISGLNSGTPIQIHDREKSIIFHTRRGSTPHNAALLRQ